MKFLVDNQLPLALARWLTSQGVDCQHVLDLSLDTASDQHLWQYAQTHGYTIVSKDEDFRALVARYGPPPQVVWVRLGNCRKAALQEVFSRLLPALTQALHRGEAVIEVRE